MIWRRHKGTNTLPPRWTSGRWTVYRCTLRGWELWDTDAQQWYGDYFSLGDAKRYAAKYDNAGTAP